MPQPTTPEPQPVKQEEIVEKPADVKEDDDDLAGEEIADDLSEISDEADDILNRQEVSSGTSSILTSIIRCKSSSFEVFLFDVNS